MTSKSFHKFAKPILAAALVLFPLFGVFTTARGATLTPDVSEGSVAPSFTAVASMRSVATAAAPAPHCTRTLRRIKTAELNAETIQISARIVREHYMDPIGTEVEFDAGSRRFVGRIERHYHEFDGKGRPWGWHKGCSLFELTCK